VLPVCSEGNGKPCIQLYPLETLLKEHLHLFVLAVLGLYSTKNVDCVCVVGGFKGWPQSSVLTPWKTLPILCNHAEPLQILTGCSIFGLTTKHIEFLVQKTSSMTKPWSNHVWKDSYLAFVTIKDSSKPRRALPLFNILILLKESTTDKQLSCWYLHTSGLRNRKVWHYMFVHTIVKKIKSDNSVFVGILVQVDVEVRKSVSNSLPSFRHQNAVCGFW